jgi:hypothetical protein
VEVRDLISHLADADPFEYRNHANREVPNGRELTDCQLTGYVPPELPGRGVIDWERHRHLGPELAEVSPAPWVKAR